MIGVQQSLFPPSESTYSTEGFYLLVANPSPAVARQVSKFKKNLTPMLGHGFGLPSKPHITVASFPLGNEQMGRFERRLAEICSSCTPFQIAVTGFGSFPTSGTIYIDVAPEKQLSALYMHTAQMLRTVMQLSAEVVPKTFQPHITIVRNLNRLDDEGQVYQKLWEGYRDAEYKASFEVNKLSLLRYQNDGKSTKLVREFVLGHDAHGYAAIHHADPSFPHERFHAASLG